MRQSGVVRDYRDEFGIGYVIQSGVLGFRRVWLEPGEPAELGDWRALMSEALRDAAQDWDDCGSGGRLSATLRAVATKEAKKEVS